MEQDFTEEYTSGKLAELCGGKISCEGWGVFLG